MRKMKDSGVPWIEDIPDSWYSIKLKYIADSNLEVLAEDTDSEKEFDYIDIGSVTYESGINQIQHLSFGNSPSRARRVLSLGDTIISTVRTYLKAIAYIDNTYNECVASTGFSVLTPKKEIVSKYLYYTLSSHAFISNVEANSVGISYPAITNSALVDMKIVVPPHEEQYRIVNYLDDKCSKIDAVILKQEQIIEKLQGYKTAIITEATTHGLYIDVDRKTSSIGWIGDIPEHWSEFRIANLYNQTSEAGNENLPILTVSINTGISDRELSDEESDRVFVRSEDRSKYKRVQPGDLAYNMMRAWQGAFGAVRVEGMVSPAYVTCRPKETANIDSRYIEYLFRTPIAIEEMHRFSHGVADFRLRLYWPEFKNIQLCLPPIKEQKEIADYIDKKSVEIEREITSRKLLIEKLAEYKKSLIYEVVTGKKEV